MEILELKLRFGAVIKQIELCDASRSKDGQIVEEVDWEQKDHIIVSLDNGHWEASFALLGTPPQTLRLMVAR